MAQGYINAKGEKMEGLGGGFRYCELGEPLFDGQKVIYCAGCLLGRDRLQAERIIVRQTPYEIKVS